MKANFSFFTDGFRNKLLTKLVLNLTHSLKICCRTTLQKLSSTTQLHCKVIKSKVMQNCLVAVYVYHRLQDANAVSHRIAN